MRNPNVKYYQIPSKSQPPNSKTKEEKIYNIRERVFCFAQRVLEIAEMLPQNRVCDVLRTQIVKSGTSIGANMEEADGAVTKRDFINKITIARKEAKETKYWLRLIAGKYIKTELLEGDLKEAQEIINILSAIINKTKGGEQIGSIGIWDFQKK